MDALLQIAPLGLGLGLGVLLRRTRLFSQADGETAAKFVMWVTLPSLILQAFNGLSPADILLPVLPAALAVALLTVALSYWLCYGSRHPKERGLLAGAACGGGQLALAAYPLAAAAFGAAGLRAALLAGVVNSLALWVGGPLLFSSAGAAFPERYEHQDGGTYRGEWLGMLKQGFGVYAYPSGAKYEGEWRNNQKEGRGVYRFPKGGVYEGEWRAGRMEGLGVRTFASGKVQAGVWRDGRLDSEMEEWQCALAVEGASEAAVAARRVPVGGGTAADTLQALLADPATWAYLCAGALVLAGRSLTPTLDLLTSQLAVAHGPLALLALGLTLDIDPPTPRQAADVAGVLALRLLPPLLLGGAALAALTWRAGWPAARALGLLVPLLLCGVAPAPPQVLANAHRYRLDEGLASAICRTSAAAALVLLPLLAVTASVSAAAGSVLPFLVALGGVVTTLGGGAVASAAGLLQDRRQKGPQGKVRMVYAPDATGAAAGVAAGAAAPAPTVSTPSPAAGKQKQQQQQQAEPAVDSETAVGQADGVSSSSSPAGEVASEPAEPLQQPRRRSAFSDVGDQPPQPPPAQALQMPRHSGASSLRWRQPLRPRHQQRGLARPAVLPVRRLVVL